MFVVIIKLKSHFQLSLIPTIANAIAPMKLRPILSGQWPITDHRMRKKAFTMEVRFYLWKRLLKVKTCVSV